MASSFPPIIAGNPPINTYRIITRAGVTSTVQAFGYSEDKSLGRIYFHQEANWSDRDNFFFLSEVAGIIQTSAFSPEEFPQKLKAEQSPENRDRRNVA